MGLTSLSLVQTDPICQLLAMELSSQTVSRLSRIILKEATRETFHFDDITVIPNFVCQHDYQRQPVASLTGIAGAARRAVVGSRLEFSSSQTSS